MPEILTESFCERCGTRYTFESAAPRKTRRLGQIKTLSKGMKNWVMSDDTSLDEAMAAARNDDDRELTSHQLDAFHATFNFCMTCRQYTCSNCWNAAEGRCLTCAPHLGQEILPAPFPDQAAFEPARIEAEAWPEVDLSVPGLAATNGNGNGSVHGAPETADPWGIVGEGDIDGIPEIDPAARLAFLSGETPTPVIEPEPTAPAAASVDSAASAWPTADETADSGPAAAAVADDGSAGATAAPVVETPAGTPIWTPTFLGTAHASHPAAEPAEPVAADAVAADAVAADAVAAEPAATPAEPVIAAAPPAPAQVAESLPPTVEGRANLGTARTSDLLKRFRPGQNIDAELAAYEAGLEGEAEPVAAEPVAAERVAAEAVAAAEPVAPAEPIAAEAVAAEAVDAVATEPVEAEPVAAIAAAPVEVPEPAEIQPEPALEIAASAAPAEPAATGQPAPVVPAPVAPPAPAWPTPAAEPVAAEAQRQDHVPQPTWQIFAPDAGQPVTPAAPAQPPAAPQWPVHPDQADSPAMALLANRANRSSSDALWAASAQEVLAPPTNVPAAGAPAGVQPCSSCGLSLSATARFCRRCGTRQG